MHRRHLFLYLCSINWSLVVSIGSTARDNPGLTFWASIATIISAVLTAYSVSQNQEVQSITNNYNDSSAQVALLTTERDSALAENERLKAQIASAPVASAAPASSPSAPALPADVTPKVRNQGTLTALAGTTNHADLDSPEGDSEWSTINNEPTGTGDGEAEGPALTNGAIYAYTPSKYYFLGKAADAGYSTCAEVPSFENDTPTTVGQLDQGVAFCWLTSAGRYALLTVASEGSAKSVTFNVTVWQKVP